MRKNDVTNRGTITWACSHKMVCCQSLWRFRVDQQKRFKNATSGRGFIFLKTEKKISVFKQKGKCLGGALSSFLIIYDMPTLETLKSQLLNISDRCLLSWRDLQGSAVVFGGGAVRSFGERPRKHPAHNGPVSYAGQSQAKIGRT